MALRFKRKHREEPEINLIPFIDVLLVVLIFLMLSTTYSRFTELQITLPTADADAARERPKEILVSITADGQYAVAGERVDGRQRDVLVQALRRAAQGHDQAVVVISADALAAHQHVVQAMDAARFADLPRLTFVAQGSATGR